jgi:hypothetical protein
MMIPFQFSKDTVHLMEHPRDLLLAGATVILRTTQLHPLAGGVKLGVRTIRACLHLNAR